MESTSHFHPWPGTERPQSQRSGLSGAYYPTGPDLGKRYLLGEEPLLVGRDPDCGVCIQHQAVLRKHASIKRVGNTYRVVDLDSTNGICVNDKPQTTALLHDGDYLRVGVCIFRFLTGGNVEAEYYEEIHRLIILDGLTGLHNRRSFQEFVDRELSRSARSAAGPGDLRHRPL